MNNEQLDQEVKKLQNEIYGLKRKLINLKLKQGVAYKKKPYEVEVLDDLEDYYYVDEAGAIDLVGIYRKYEQKEIYIRGLAFETVEEAEQNDKERILLLNYISGQRSATKVGHRIGRRVYQNISQCLIGLQENSVWELIVIVEFSLNFLTSNQTT